MGPPNTLPDQAPVVTDNAIMATTIYKLLMQFTTPKGIRVEIDRSMWPKADGLPEKVQGRVEQWVNKARMQLDQLAAAAALQAAERRRRPRQTRRRRIG